MGWIEGRGLGTHPIPSTGEKEKEKHTKRRVSVRLLTAGLFLFFSHREYISMALRWGF